MLGLERVRVLGNGKKEASAVPVDVPGLTGVTAISTGMIHSCVLTSAGGAKCWGWNRDGGSATAAAAQAKASAGLGPGCR